MGCFQALEVLKIASGRGCILFPPKLRTVPSLAILLLYISMFCWVRWTNQHRTADRVFIVAKLVIKPKQAEMFFFCTLLTPHLPFPCRALTLLCLQCSHVNIETQRKKTCPILPSDTAAPGFFYVSQCCAVLQWCSKKKWENMTPNSLIQAMWWCCAQSGLSLDRAWKLPAASSWWCLMPKTPDSGPSSWDQSRPAVQCAEKTPVWHSWRTMRLSVGLLPRIRLVIRDTFWQEFYFLKW